VVSSRLRAVGKRWLRHLGRIGGGVAVGSVVAVEGLSSQEGCARLVVRNFGSEAAARAAGAVDIGSWAEAVGSRGSGVQQLPAVCWVGDGRAGAS
jgi:hypothetical protein